LSALKALVKEKGQKMNPDHGDIPPLCSCGAQNENVKQLKNGKDDDAVHVCAVNC